MEKTKTQMKKIKIKNKKAVSEVVSYVMLIVIAITLSIIVFAFLKSQIQTTPIECPDTVSIIIKDYVCDEVNNEIALNFQNKGNFIVDGIFIRFSDSAESAPVSTINPLGSINDITKEQWTDGFFYFGRRNVGGENIIPLPLSPNRNYTQRFDYSSSSDGNLLEKIKKVQIQPFISDEEKQEAVICESATITQELIGCN